MNDFDWKDIKIFIAAPRELSARRFTEIVKHYLPKGNIVLGISEEPFVVGFEDQPQFRMLEQKTVQALIDKIQKSKSPYKVYPLLYSQKDLEIIASSLHEDQRVLLVNGSWKYTFHNHPAYKILTENKVPIKFISPFTDEDEARAYAQEHASFVDLPQRGELLSEEEMFTAAELASTQSFDYSFQTGAALGKKHDGKYEIIATAYNKVIPYQTYAMHHGNSREKNKSRPHDTNHYDTIHAEMVFLVEAARGLYDLDGSTLFVNLLPCPNCARTLSQTTIDSVVYRNDHSGGYASELMKLCGKKVKRMAQA